MALTPEDVVNKRFQPTKFREGYDQDEVDDFLDEVVVELRRLNQENEELRSRLVASDSKVSELQRTSAQAPPPASGYEQPQVAAAVAPPAPAPIAAPAPAAVAPYTAPESDPSMDPSNTNNLLQLARRLHEEHVREGVEKKEALIAEGQATAARTVDEANATAARTLDEAKTNAARVTSEAQEQQRAQLGSLDQERQALETRIDELRTFEREYRQKLKSYIEGQLRDLDSTAAVLTPAGAPAAAASAASAPAPASAPTPVASVPAQEAPAQSVPAQGLPAQGFGSPVAPPPANYPGFAGN